MSHETRLVRTVHCTNDTLYSLRIQNGLLLNELKKTVTRLGNDKCQTSPKVAQLSRNLSAQRYITVTRLKSIYRYLFNLETVGFWLHQKLLSSRESQLRDF
ncbi:hypothetical protein CEXT_94031 [Caerostris extrusa]|uniref:Uncharacterized protein n=1 Tax=Caerostris extrusa TaxID=172846 RepID=A0AAV4Q820_CAEEX|nr:hypothetical protein CEXT_94031 [Caerostris extrusa]